MTDSDAAAREVTCLSSFASFSGRKETLSEETQTSSVLELVPTNPSSASPGPSAVRWMWTRSTAETSSKGRPLEGSVPSAASSRIRSRLCSSRFVASADTLECPSAHTIAPQVTSATPATSTIAHMTRVPMVMVRVGISEVTSPLCPDPLGSVRRVRVRAEPVAAVLSVPPPRRSTRPGAMPPGPGRCVRR